MDTNRPGQRNMQIATMIVAAIATVTALYFGRDVLIPLALAMFFSFLLTPVVRSVERLRIGRAPAVLVVVGLSAALVGSIGWFVGVQITDLAEEVPKYRENIIEKVRGLRTSASSFSEMSETVEQIKEEIRTPSTSPATQPDDPSADVAAADEAATEPGGTVTSDLRRSPAIVAGNGEPPPEETEGSLSNGDAASSPAGAKAGDEPLKVQIVPPGPDLTGLLGGMVGSVVHPLTVGGIAAVFSVFFLAYREDLRDRLIRLCGRAHIDVTTTALSDVAKSLTRYIVVQVAVNSINGAAVAAGLLMIGVPNAALWGLMSAILRFVPFVGTWIAAILPISLSIAVFEGWTRPLLVVGWILVVDMLSVNVLEPLMYGARTGISPTAILIAAVFWTWLWGGIGLFLATPISVCLATLGKYVPQLEVLYVLISDRPALEPRLRFYQRLIAHDRDEARNIVRQAMRSMPPDEVANSILVPALKQVETNRRAGTMDADQQAFAREVVIELLEMIKRQTEPHGEQPSTPAASGTGGVAVTVPEPPGVPGP